MFITPKAYSLTLADWEKYLQHQKIKGWLNTVYKEFLQIIINNKKD